MTPEKLVDNIIVEIVTNNLNHYKVNLNTLKTVDLEEIKVKEWQSVMRIYKDLDIDKSNDFIDFLKLVITDTLSNVFGILDGVTYLEGQEENMVLTYKENKLNGDLQDIFLNKENY